MVENEKKNEALRSLANESSQVQASGRIQNSQPVSQISKKNQSKSEISSVLASVNPSNNEQSKEDDLSKAHFKVFTEVKKLKRGECIGEMALQYGAKSKFQVQCVTDCVFAVLTMKAYTKFIKHAADNERDETVDFLRKEPMFALWSKSNLTKLLESVTLQKLYKEKLVLQEDEVSKYFYLIKDGEFELTKKLVKLPVNKMKREAFIDDEHVRLTDLTHGIERNNDDVLHQKNHFLEGDLVGFVGPGHPVTEKLKQSDLVKNRAYHNRERHNLTELHHRIEQAQDDHVSPNQVSEHRIMTLYAG